MGYLEKQLVPGEQVRAARRPHVMHLLIVLVRRAWHLALLLLIVRAIQSEFVTWVLSNPFLLQFLPDEQPLPIPYYVVRLCGILALGTALAALFDALRWLLTNHALTDHRLLSVTGVLERSCLETPLDRVDEFLLVQSPVGQWLDYGNLSLLTGSREEGHLMRRVPRALAFKKAIQAAREAWVGRGEEVRPAAGATRERRVREIKGMISELAGLRDHGLLTPEEHDEKKREILSRL